MKRVIFLILCMFTFSISLFAKVSNPTFISAEGGVDLIYLSSTTTYKFNLLEDNNNLSIKTTSSDVTIVVMDVVNGEVIDATNFVEPFNELNINNLPKGEYSLLFSGGGDFSIFTNSIDLKNKLTIEFSVENYEFKLDRAYSNIVISEADEGGFLTLSSMSSSDLYYQNIKEPFNILNIATLDMGTYQLNVTINPSLNDTNVSSAEEVDEPTINVIDKTQKFSNPKLSANGKEIELTYASFTREYILKLDELQTNVVIEKESDCGIFVKKLEDENFKGICKDEVTNSFKAQKVEAGSYNINIVGNEEFKIYSNSGDLKDKLELVGKSDSYLFTLNSITRDIDLIDLNESLEVSIVGKLVNYHNLVAPYNILNVPLLSEGDYEVVVHTSNLRSEIVEVDSKYKFSNPKFLVGDDNLEVFYTNFARHYHFIAKEDYKNVVITKEGDGCGVVIKNLSNGGEIITSCKNEIKNRLSLDLVKSGDYVITVIGGEKFSITSDNIDLKEFLRLGAMSDNYTFILDKISRDILISEDNSSAKIEIYDTNNESFKYSKEEYPFNFMSIPYLRAGTYTVNIIALIENNTSVKRPDSAEIFADENKTEIKLKPIELISGNISNIKTVVESDGRVEAVIGISDKEDNIIKQTILKAPKGSEVEMDEIGNLKQILKTTRIKAEILAESSGRVSAKIDINEDEKLEREFIVPAGSETEVKEDGTTTAINEVESEKGNYETNVEIKSDGEVSATAFLYSDTNQRATKLSTGLLTASYTARREFSSVKVEFIWDEVNSSRKLRATKIDSGLLKATYTTRRSFSFEGETLNSRSIDISSSTNIIIIPSPEATFEENQQFLGENEGYRTIELIDGEANITIDGQTSIMRSESYILPKIDGKELYLAEGWNLISIPIDVDMSSDITSEDVNYTLDSFGSYVEFWKFDNNSWEKNPDVIKSGEGFWIYLNAENYSLFMGSGYDMNFSNLSDGWYLFGAGKDLENLKDEYNFKEIYKFSRENNISTWIKDPSIIYRGEGFWINN